MSRFIPMVVLALALACVVTAAGCGGTRADADVAVRFTSPTASASTTEPVGDPTTIAPPDLVLSTMTTDQGGAILVSVTGGGIKEGSVKFLGRSYPLT